MILKGDGETVEGSEKIPTLEEVMAEVGEEQAREYGERGVT